MRVRDGPRDGLGTNAYLSVPVVLSYFALLAGEIHVGVPVQLGTSGPDADRNIIWIGRVAERLIPDLRGCRRRIPELRASC